MTMRSEVCAQTYQATQAESRTPAVTIALQVPSSLQTQRSREVAVAAPVSSIGWRRLRVSQTQLTRCIVLAVAPLQSPSTR